MVGPRHLLVTALAVVWLAVPSGAFAGDGNDRTPDRTVALMTAQIGGDADPALRTQLQDAVRRGLGAAGYTLIDRDQLVKQLSGDESLIDCISKTCLAQISDAVGARRFMRAKIEASGASYTIELELLDMQGESLRKLDESCAVCTILELSDLVAKVAESLMTTREQKPVPVVIVTQPAGAQLEVDGRVLGPAPFTGELPPGEHRIVARLAAHAESDQTLEVKAGGEQQRFEIILAPVEPPKKDDGPRRPFRVWKYVAAGGAVAALATGTYLLAIHHDGTCSASDAECPDRYNTLLGGLGSLGLGVALGGASGWMFLRDASDARAAERKPAAAIVPTRGGAFATVRLRF